jgi:hypothetical protein
MIIPPIEVRFVCLTLAPFVCPHRYFVLYHMVTAIMPHSVVAINFAPSMHGRRHGRRKTPTDFFGFLDGSEAQTVLFL